MGIEDKKQWTYLVNSLGIKKVSQQMRFSNEKSSLTVYMSVSVDDCSQTIYSLESQPL